uniref:Putative suppressor of cytokine signaling at 16d isoform b n=1 Tax=Lutzomyia longipalpis TaxID=7200 RepID=A0A1B0CCV7_LUTLO
MDGQHDDVDLGVEQRNLHMRNSRHHVSVTSLSDDSGFSGLPHTSSSISSGDSSRVGPCKFEFELVESDGEFDSLDNCSDGGMSAENFNTLKKGPLAPIDPPPEFQDSPQTTLLRSPIIQDFANTLTEDIISEAAAACSRIQISEDSEPTYSDYYAQFDTLKKPPKSTLGDRVKVTPQIYASDTVLNTYDYTEDNIYDEPNGELLTSSTSDMEACNNHHIYRNYLLVPHRTKDTDSESPIRDCPSHSLRVPTTPCGSCYRRKTPPKASLYSPLHHTGSNLSTGNRPNSRNSLTSRLSSSHNSLSMSASKADDSSFITQAMSHDALTGREISDFYNVPIDSDVYALPIDMVRPGAAAPDIRSSAKSRNRLKYVRNNKKRRKEDKVRTAAKASKAIDKRHSVPDSCIQTESKRLLHNLYANSSDSSDATIRKPRVIPWGRMKCSETSVQLSGHSQVLAGSATTTKASSQSATVKSSTAKKASSENVLNNNNNLSGKMGKFAGHHKKPQFSIPLNLKQKFCSIFRFRKSQQKQQRSNVGVHNNNHGENWDYENQQNGTAKGESKKKIILRALPPLPGRDSAETTNTNPANEGGNVSEEETSVDDGLVKMDFTSSIEKIKQYGWYWGPISSEAAERILSNEPDGSFIVRDSSDDHYIFSLTFKLNRCVRHVRIEQDQGTFSFGSFAKFKSRTIVEFIEKAVEHSRSGRYLFFLHRRPEHGPMRVQLTNPVSRFKHVQSLQHMCRFVILKAVVRKDLIQTLPLPRRIIDYLSYKNVYSEQIESDSSTSQASNGQS